MIDVGRFKSKGKNRTITNFDEIKVMRGSISRGGKASSQLLKKRKHKINKMKL